MGLSFMYTLTLEIILQFNCLCVLQAGWGKCSQAFMSGFCDQSCGRCAAAACTDTPPNSQYTCAQQVSSSCCIHVVSTQCTFCIRCCCLSSLAQQTESMTCVSYICRLVGVSAVRHSCQASVTRLVAVVLLLPAPTPLPTVSTPVLSR